MAVNLFFLQHFDLNLFRAIWIINFITFKYNMIRFRAHNQISKSLSYQTFLRLKGRHVKKIFFRVVSQQYIQNSEALKFYDKSTHQRLFYTRQIRVVVFFSCEHLKCSEIIKYFGQRKHDTINSSKKYLPSENVSLTNKR